MEDFYMNISSQDQSNDWTNFTTDYQNYTNVTTDDENYNYVTTDSDDYNYGIYNLLTIWYMTSCVVVSLGLPLSLAAIVSLRAQVSSDHVAPIYVINLLVSDILQFCCLIVEVAGWNWRIDSMIYSIFYDIYFYSLLVSVGFMVCVAMERYLVIVHPLWYRCRRTIKTSMVVCVMVWLIPLVDLLTYYFGNNHMASHIIFNTFFLLPLPLLIFFLGATVKALSASISVSTEEKRRIVGVLVLVLLIYTLMFLPTVVWFLVDEHIPDLFNVAFVFRKLSPLADLVLYVFMRKGAVDKLLAAVCCC